MAIKEINLGPRSRVLEAKDAADALLGAKVMGGLLPPQPEVPVAPAGSLDVPMSLVGCACGKVHVPDRKAPVLLDGVTHRYGRACYREDPDLGRIYYDRVPVASLEDRVKALETVVADLVSRMGST